MQKHVSMVTVTVVVALAAGACRPQTAQQSEPRVEQASPPAPASPSTGGNVQIEFRSDPDPPRTGSNQLEVTVRREDGTPVTDATVTAEFFMPAMPAMNMPEMRNSAALTHEGGGIYRGTGQVMMAGSWEVTITARRGAEALGVRTLTVTAR